jgi:hypothetical protein
MMAHELLDRVYFDPSHPASLGGIERLYKYAKDLGISKEQVVKYLQSIDAYTEHKPFSKKFKRRKTIVADIGDQHQIDLADMQKFSEHNDGYKYLLMIIDCFSRYGWGVPVKSKKPSEIIQALSEVYKKDGIPLKVQSDNGKEFTAGAVRKFFKESGITFFTTTNDDIKCAFVERLNRTIKNRLWLYMTHQNNYRYIDVLQDVMMSYNYSIHSETGFAPVDVDGESAMIIREKMLRDIELERDQKPVFKIGDRVRVAKRKKTFEKGYETNFTEQIFEITGVFKKNKKNVYTVEEVGGEPIVGTFYESELTKVDTTSRAFHRISRILRQRKLKNGTTQCLVRWKGYGPAYDSWENKNDLE